MTGSDVSGMGVIVGNLNNFEGPVRERRSGR